MSVEFSYFIHFNFIQDDHFNQDFMFIRFKIIQQCHFSRHDQWVASHPFMAALFLCPLLHFKNYP